MAITNPPIIYSGTLAAGTNKVSELLSAVEGVLTLLVGTSSGTPIPAWSMYDNIASGSEHDRIYRSIGDPNLGFGQGDTRSYIRLRQMGGNDARTIRLHAYNDWSTTQNSFHYVTPTSSMTIPSSSGSLRWWASYNEYEAVIITSQSNGWSGCHFGQLFRRCPEPHRGRAFTSSPVTAGSNVVVQLDRNVFDVLSGSNRMLAGMSASIISLTPQGNSLATYVSNYTSVVAVSGSTVTLATLASNFTTGAIVGFDPLPSFVCGMVSHAQGLALAGGHLFWCGLNGAADVSVAGTPNRDGGGIVATDVDPADNSNKYYGYRILYEDSVSGIPRGASTILNLWSFSSSVDHLNQYMRHNYDNSFMFRAIPISFAVSTGFQSCLHVTGIGD